MHNACVVIWNTKCGSLLIGPLFEVILFVLLDIFEMDSHIFVSVRAGVGVVNPKSMKELVFNYSCAITTLSQ